jgi:hypothetical protein
VETSQDMCFQVLLSVLMAAAMTYQRFCTVWAQRKRCIAGVGHMLALEQMPVHVCQTPGCECLRELPTGAGCLVNVTWTLAERLVIVALPGTTVGGLAMARYTILLSYWIRSWSLQQPNRAHRAAPTCHWRSHVAGARGGTSSGSTDAT